MNAIAPPSLATRATTHDRRLRTGVFGGSFNPIHVGHIALARQILQAAHLEEVWFMVSPLNPFKTNDTQLLDDRSRLDLTSRALATEPTLKASDYEFHLPKPSYMWNTLKHIASDYPERTFILIIGADNWLAFDRWAEPQYILSHHEIAVYPRKGYPIDRSKLPPNVHLVDTQLYPLSSTEIRRRVKARQPIDGLVPDAILPIVQKLYR